MEKIINDNLQKLKERFPKIKPVDIIVWLGLAGMILIFISSFMGDNSKKEKGISSKPTSLYEKVLEDRLTDIIGSISGVGDTKVMVTLEKSAEKLYAKEIKDNTDKTEDYSGEELQAVKQKVNNEVNYILVDGPSGKKEALITAELEPEVKGVVIVCAGASNPKVVNDVIEAVTTALDIPSSRVCVTKMG